MCASCSDQRELIVVFTIRTKYTVLDLCFVHKYCSIRLNLSHIFNIYSRFATLDSILYSRCLLCCCCSYSCVAAVSVGSADCGACCCCWPPKFIWYHEECLSVSSAQRTSKYLRIPWPALPTGESSSLKISQLSKIRRTSAMKSSRDL